MYAGLVPRLAAVTRLWIFVPDIPLAPERRFPAAHDSAIAACYYVLGNGPLTLEKSKSVFLADDSCGAALALVTGMRLRDELGSNCLSAIVGLSSTLDMTATGESYSRCRQTDKVITRELTKQCIAMYAPDKDPSDPMLSPIYGRFGGLPPVLLQVSEDEAVFDDSTRTALLAQQQGCQLDLETWRGLPHVWHLLAPHLAEARIAIDGVGRFIRKVNGDEAE
jgi:epsilon-lactone hydrolase